MSPTPPADADEEVESALLPSVLRGQESTPIPGATARGSDRGEATPATSAVQPVLRVPPKKETLKLFPYSGNMGAPKPATPPATEPDASKFGAIGKAHQTPKARAAVPEKARAKGPPPKDPATVHAALEPLLAWMPEEQRPEVTKQLLCGEYDGVLRTLSEHRQRYPKNLTIGKAVEVVEEALGTRLLHDLGPLNSEIIVVGSEPAGRGNIGALLRLARQAATLGELLDKTPLGRVRTLQLVAQLVKEGTLAVRTVAKPTGFGHGALSNPSMETVKRRLSGEMPSVLGSLAEVKAAANAASNPPPDRLMPTPEGEEDAADALFAQLERATLPDPSEVAASLQKLRDRNMTPAMRPQVAAQLRKRFDDRVDQDGKRAPTDESTDKPPVAHEGSEAPTPADARQTDAPAAKSRPAEEPIEIPPGSKMPEQAASSNDQDKSSRLDDAKDAVEDAEPNAEAGRVESKSVVPDPAIYAELKRLRPEPIREGEDQARPNPPFLLIGVGAIGLIAIALSLYALFGRQPEPAPASLPETKRAPTTEPTPAITNTVPTVTAAQTQAAPTAPALQNITLEVEVSPHYAQVYLDGTLLTKPFKRTIARDDRKHELRIEAGGYKAQTRTFTIKGDTSFVVALEPIIGRKKEGAPGPDGPVYP